MTSNEGRGQANLHQQDLSKLVSSNVQLNASDHEVVGKMCKLSCLNNKFEHFVNNGLKFYNLTSMIYEVSL